MSESPSYIDYESFLDPTFSAVAFANNLILTTNNPSDTPLDLTTPLSRVLFDIQEIDTHIHNLTAQSALPLLTHTKESSEASQRILTDVGAQIGNLRDGYQRLEKEVVRRWEEAEQVRVVTERLWRTVRLGRALGRCLSLGRQLEVQIAEFGGSESAGTAGRKNEDHRAMVRAANTVLLLREMFSATGPGEEGEGLDMIRVAVTLRDDLMRPAERHIISRAQQIIREFSMISSSSTTASSSSSRVSTTTTYNQTEETKSRTTSALLTLHLLSPATLLSTLQSHLQTALTSSLASLTRTLLATTTPNNTNTSTLDRTLVEISSRCQTIVALEALLESIQPTTSSPNPAGKETQAETEEREREEEEEEEQEKNLLQPLLKALDTTSLPSHFWRALAGGLSSRAAVVASGSQARAGATTTTTTTTTTTAGGSMSKERTARVKEMVRDCVIRGFSSPGLSYGGAGKEDSGGARVSREREVAVMVGAVLGVLSGGGGGGGGR